MSSELSFLESGSCGKVKFSETMCSVSAWILDRKNLTKETPFRMKVSGNRREACDGE